MVDKKKQNTQNHKWKGTLAGCSNFLPYVSVDAIGNLLGGLRLWHFALHEHVIASQF